MRTSMLSLVLLLLPGCPGSMTTDGGLDVPGASDTPSVDAPSLDAPSMDAPRSDDVPASPDVPGADVPADAPSSDGALACGVAPIPDFTAGVCDGRGMMGCTRWATALDPAAVARCVPPDGRCARADTCAAGGCTCGGGPECGDDQLCVARPGGGFGCACLPGSSCTSTPVPDFESGVCDGMGRMGCTMWAQGLGGSMAVAQCVPPMGRCARADACGAGGCTCGGGPECADNEMCVSGIAGFSCVCLP